MGILYDLTFGFCKEKKDNCLFMVEWRNDVRFEGGIVGEALNENWRRCRYYGKNRSKDREVVEVCLRATNHPDYDVWGIKKKIEEDQRSKLLNMFWCEGYEEVKLRTDKEQLLDSIDLQSDEMEMLQSEEIDQV